jgi:hypothetical protein
MTVPHITKLYMYSFPTQCTAGQIITIFSEGRYLKSDIITYYAGLAGLTAPTDEDPYFVEANLKEALVLFRNISLP